MKITTVGKNGAIALIEHEGLLITDSRSALDLAVSVQYESGACAIVLHKVSVCEDFFKLSTCLAGEVLQKFVNYDLKMAIVGDYSRYTSKPLRDFIYESNKGRHFFFVSSVEEAIEKLHCAMEI